MDTVIRFIALTSRAYPAVKKVYLFGSRAKGTQNDKSDFDLAVEWDQGVGNSWGEFTERLREKSPALNPMDLVDISFVGDELRTRILSEGVIIYDKNSTIV